MPRLPLALLVDRDADTRRMYSDYLRLAHWCTDEAADGREALAKAIAMGPSVVVTETRLAGMSGYDLCGILRRDAATRAIPIVVVTGDAYTADVERARLAGATSVLTKPCLPEELLAEIKRLCTAADTLLRTGRSPRSRRARSGPVLEEPGDPRQRVLSHTHKRHDTTTPPIPPPTLVCPQCDQPLVYRRSHVGGVSARHPEQWDDFECPNSCGTFQYRERTRKIRKVS